MEFGSNEVLELTGLSYRQLDHGLRSGLLRSAGGEGRGRGVPRRFDFPDVLTLSLLREVLAVPLPARVVVPALRLIQDARTPRSFARLRGAVVWTDGRDAGLVTDIATQPSLSSAIQFRFDLGVIAERVSQRLETLTRKSTPT